MAASLVIKRPGPVPRLEFRTLQTAARTVLRFAEGGLTIPSIVDEHNSVIWDYPGGDMRAEPGRGALERLRVLAAEAPTSPAGS
jgi:hypothetical protein